MQKLRLIIYAAFIVVLCLTPLVADDGGIPWLSDYKEGLRSARQTRRPMLVEFRCEA